MQANERATFAKMPEGIYTIELLADGIKTGTTKFSVIH
jgi:hypothetical protein